ncbi:MAG: polyprenyl synthetase family protein [Dehalococcoidia bacterium]
MTALAQSAQRHRVAVQREMREVVGDAPEPLFAWMRYHLGWQDADGAAVESSPGKMLRPVALLLAVEQCGGSVEQALPAAAAVELVHNFSLIHDDVEDASAVRRGRPTLWALTGAAHAINTGDGVYTLAHLAMQRPGLAALEPARVLAAMRELDEACLRLVRGQHLDMSFEGRMDVTQDEYLAMADGKTAAMFAAPLAMGALLGGAPAGLVDAYREFGRRLGLAFQAVDDVLGIWGDPAVTGKPVGDDLRSRKMTYPVIAALEAGGEPSAALRRAYGSPPADDAETTGLRALVDRTPARGLTETMAQREEQAALDALRAARVSDGTLALWAQFAREAVGRVS